MVSNSENGFNKHTLFTYTVMKKLMMVSMTVKDESNQIEEIQKRITSKIELDSDFLSILLILIFGHTFAIIAFVYEKFSDLRRRRRRRRATIYSLYNLK